MTSAAKMAPPSLHISYFRLGAAVPPFFLHPSALSLLLLVNLQRLKSQSSNNLFFHRDDFKSFSTHKAIKLFYNVSQNEKNYLSRSYK